MLRLRVPNTGSMVELSSKFGALPGEAVDLIAFARNNKLEVEGLSFHVGSQCTNVQNYIQALQLGARASLPKPKRAASSSSCSTSAADSPRTTTTPSRRSRRWRKAINAELDRLFPQPIEILAEPGRFLVASAATADRADHRQGRPRRASSATTSTTACITPSAA